jgi:membrane protein YqaA with SNARE-associated domain
MRIEVIVCKLKHLVQIQANNLIKKLRQVDRREYVSYFLFICGLCLALFISIPTVAGTFGVIWGNEELPSATASIQLAFISTALGGVVLWYVTYLSKRFRGKASTKTRSVKRFEASQRRGALMVGTMLLFAAMCFTLFALLCPLFPEVKAAEDLWSSVVKWTSVLSVMAGSMTLGISLCVGIFEIWTWSLTWLPKDD